MNIKSFIILLLFFFTVFYISLKITESEPIIYDTTEYIDDEQLLIINSYDSIINNDTVTILVWNDSLRTIAE